MTWEEPLPRDLESVQIGQAVGLYGSRLIQADAHQSDWPAKRVLSETPSARVRELRSMNYADYLDTPEWRDISRRMKQLAHGKCEDCGATRHLNVHHLTYERLGAEFASDFLVLCNRCHMTFHEIMPDQVRHG